MPFVLIQGTFHLANRTSTGVETGFEPDGDSIHFKPSKPTLLDRLEPVGSPYRLTNIGSTQLRFEGIDALELHFRPDNGSESHQPRPLADESRDYLTGRYRLNPVPYVQPRGIRVDPPLQRDAAPGYILSRSLDAHGRPVAFAFVGDPPAPDGSEVRLEVPLLRRSLNYRSVANGHAYPLFYDTLFADLRGALTTAADNARSSGKHLWALDRSQDGLAVDEQTDLEHDGVIFPKLFRRLTEFLTEPQSALGNFLGWLAKTEEQVLDLVENNFTHFDNLVEVSGGSVRLKRRPEQIVFVSAKTASPAVAPWLGV
ncbi:MAG TPA: hypothetical protein VHI55_09625 [Gaiellaceae bacterium]|jgi:hypothetical protein|nr:hypothetical protein [Gaiellaceae bacterium]